MPSIIKFPQRRYSQSFLRALQGAHTFHEEGMDADQLMERAIEKLRAGTTEAELIEVTGWSMLQVRGFLHGFLAEPLTTTVVVSAEGDRVSYKLLEIATGEVAV